MGWNTDIINKLPRDEYEAKTAKNLAPATAWRGPDCKIPSDLCPFNANTLGFCSQSLPAHSEGSGLLGPIRGSVFYWLSTRSQWLSTRSQPFLRIWSCHPAPTLLPFSIPVLIIGSLFCHQTPVLFSLVLSGETVPESWSYGKGFPVLAQFCFVLFFKLLKALTFSSLWAPVHSPTPPCSQTFQPACFPFFF